MKDTRFIRFGGSSPSFPLVPLKKGVNSHSRPTISPRFEGHSSTRPIWGSMYVYLDIAHHINLLKCLYYKLWLLLDVARSCQNEISNVAAHFSYGWLPNMLMVIINLKVGNDPDNLVDQTGQAPIFTCSPSLSSCMSLQFIISFM